ncbi:hypothetical protein JB92DRAFT_3060266, partial [Gautieria morchelliformis]
MGPHDLQQWCLAITIMTSGISMTSAYLLTSRYPDTGVIASGDPRGTIMVSSSNKFRPSLLGDQRPDTEIHMPNN